jgi:hypothetical protein
MRNVFFKCLMFLPILFFVNSIKAQDIITLKNGDEIKSKVLEVLSDQVKYKKWENIDGPTYSSMKTEVFMIKYQNGTKDVFKSTEVLNTNVSLVSSEETKKTEAVTNLENYVKNKITGQVIKFDGFRKTNGVMNNVFGQMVYTINFDVDIKFVTNGWLKGNDLEGWWNNNFYVYPSQPNLSTMGEMYTGTKMIPVGTFITLGCVAEMNSTDNGFLVKSLSIKTVTNHGLVENTNQNNNTPTNTINKTPGFYYAPVDKNIPIDTTPKIPGYIGDLKEGIKEGKGKLVYENGLIYEGEWKNNKRNGYGILTDNKKNTYKGYWKDDMRDSTGVVANYKDEILEKGIYKNDKLYDGELICSFDIEGTISKTLIIVKKGVWGKQKKIR